MREEILFAAPIFDEFNNVVKIKLDFCLASKIINTLYELGFMQQFKTL